MVKLSKSAFEAICRHGEEAFPHECCGVLFGKSNGEAKIVHEVFVIENQFDEAERHHRFLITPDNYREAEKISRAKKVDILGFYHSHPDSPSIASKYDLDHAFPWFSYIIISVMKKKYHDIHSWVMENDRSKFNEEHVAVE
jgi:proteasome lid subunit RPN8/RPN11